MAQPRTTDPMYVMGRTEAEAQRLMLQSRLLERLTRRFLVDAGIAPGMTVLDVVARWPVSFAARSTPPGCDRLTTPSLLVMIHA